jgi:Zn-dependent protease
MSARLIDILLFAIPAVYAVTLHEVAHGWVANKLGDSTAAERGRLSLNPLRHVDPIGTILVPGALILMGGIFFGWAKPVPVNWFALRRVRRDIALVAVAGPAANLGMLLLWLLLLEGLRMSGGTGGLVVVLLKMCLAGIIFNATIMILNLIPIPPLDGSRILTAALPARVARVYNRIEPFGLVLLLLLLFSGWLGALLGPVLNLVQTFIGMRLSA